MRGGAPYTPAYSFRDLIGHNSGDKWGWSGAQIVNSNRFVLQNAAGINRWGANTSLAIQIQANDLPLGGTPGVTPERNEVLQMFGTGETDSAPGAVEYYAISVYVPSPWVIPTGSSGIWFIVAQSHGPDTNTGHSGQANIQLLLASDLAGITSGHMAFRTVGGPITGGGSIPGADDVPTDLGPIVTNTWVDFAFKIVRASDVEGNGHVTVWKRVVGTDATLVQMADYAAPTMYSVNGVTQLTNYWKRGIYRNADGGQGTVTYYASPFTRASTLAAACMGSFGQYP